MILTHITVPDYVAERFEQPLKHPSKNANAAQLQLTRVYRLVHEALKDINFPDWEVANRLYHSENSNEPYGFEEIEGKFYIYAEERGRRRAIAIFKSAHSGANYFVWLVSDGKKKIDWTLCLDMEP